MPIYHFTIIMLTNELFQNLLIINYIQLIKYESLNCIYTEGLAAEKEAVEMISKFVRFPVISQNKKLIEQETDFRSISYQFIDWCLSDFTSGQPLNLHLIA